MTACPAQTVDKFYPELSRRFAQFLAQIRGRQVAVIGHARPDGDCIGAQVALARVLATLGHAVVCVNADAVPRRLQFLVPGMIFLRTDTVLRDATDYAAVFVDCADHSRAGERLKARFPTPGAQVADNDLALGQIIEATSRSRFWPETCIFVIEDDPQDGWDHVSGYRTTAYVASPYTRRGVTVSTQYNHTSLLRTLELMLGLPPMNQLDATATPMFDCFTNAPDLTPFAAVPSNIPLDQMNPEPRKVSDPLLRKDAYASARLPLDQPDQCPEELLNRILWHAMKGSHAPYPEWAARPQADKD